MLLQFFWFVLSCKLNKNVKTTILLIRYFLLNDWIFFCWIVCGFLSFVLVGKQNLWFSVK